MDTSILGTLHEMAPDLMQELEVRALILERVAALGPIGRRALALRLNMAEREVRSAADALRSAGCIMQSAAGMEATDLGKTMVQAARLVSKGRRSLSSIELELARRLNVQRVCVVHGDADVDDSALDAAANAAAQQVRFLLQDARVLAVSGGEEMARTAQEIAIAAPMDVTVVPGQGCTSEGMRTQANSVAEVFAEKLGGQSRMLHLPENIPAQAMEEFAHMPQVREALELIRSRDVLFYSIRCAQESADRRGAGAAERAAIRDGCAQAEALGLYFDYRGEVIGAKETGLMRARDMERCTCAAIAAGRSKAEAVMAVCAHHAHRLLVLDEGAALKMVELLRI